jgi:diguanylate cyclase (GGDEF)-like protein
MITSVTVDVFLIIPLCFTIILAKRHVLQNQKNLYYIAASVITIILLVLEIASFLLAKPNETGLIAPNRLVNVLGFSLSPAVPYIVFLFVSHKKKDRLNKRLLALPLCLNALICVLSYNTGWIFFVDAQNRYARGALFIFTAVTAMFYYLLIIIDIFKNKYEFGSEDKRFLVTVALLPVIATILQILFPELLLIWGSVSIALLLYYIFLLEQQFVYDLQTGVRNRTAFEKEMQQLIHLNATIFVFDINDLKSVNDKYGHKAGDDMIQDAVSIIEECFAGIGKTYRIGGDEFCVICRQLPAQTAESALSEFDKRLLDVNRARSNQIKIAHGYASCNFQEGETLETALFKADNAMYAHKTQLKGIDIA